MYNSIATVSLSGSLPAKLAAVAGAGYDGVELFEADVLADTHSPREIGRMIADHGLRCVALQPFRDLEGLSGARRKAAFHRLERKLDLLPELGTDLLIVCSSTVSDSSGDEQRIAADLHELARRAGGRGLRAAYEALAWGAHVSDHRHAWALIQQAEHPSLGIALDSFHSLVRSLPIGSIGDLDPQRIFLVQLADAPLIQMDVLQRSRHLRCMPGQGGLPMVEFVRALIEIGYDDALSLEIFNDSFRAASTQVTALDGLRSLIATRDEALRGIAGRDHACLPPRIRPERVDFIEFAASRSDASRLEAMFGRFGFARRGRHRSKAVSLWRQGAVNLVINGEPEGFPAAHAITHGASVCAIALAVPDIEAAKGRAAGLRVPAEEQRHGPGERDLPAIRGVGGSLIEFVAADRDAEAGWMEDFHLDPEPPGSGAGLQGIDHFTQTVAHVDALSWPLFYKSLFAVDVDAHVDIADPLGLVQSQAICPVGGRPGEGFTVVINSSASGRTLSSRFVAHYFGAGVQQIALSTADLFASADKLAAAGVEFLPIPANYYADLEARFGLEPDLLERMRARHIVYDRDDDGEYFHLFTRAFDRLFFFEIVERRGGYRAFDVSGAGIRLAAQTRLKILPV